MGAGILPTTIYKGKLYFLFGKEGEYETSAKGYSDFGGGTDNNEGFLETACREAAEEMTGFLGSSADVLAMLKKSGSYAIDYKGDDAHKLYRMHIFPFAYNACFPFYYNNNQRFLQKNLDAAIFKRTKIFEKAEIAWFSIDEMMRRKKEFRSYFQNIIDIVWAQREKIEAFIRESGEHGGSEHTCHRQHLSRRRRRRPLLLRKKSSKRRRH